MQTPITFETTLNMVKQLSLTDQLRLLEWIANQVKNALAQLFISPLLINESNPNRPTPKGVPGQHLLQFAGLIPMSDLQQISQAITEDCSRIDANEW